MTPGNIRGTLFPVPDNYLYLQFGYRVVKSNSAFRAGSSIGRRRGLASARSSPCVYCCFSSDMNVWLSSVSRTAPWGVVCHHHTHEHSEPFSPVQTYAAYGTMAAGLSNQTAGTRAGGPDQGCGTGSRSARSDHRFCARSSPGIKTNGKTYHRLAA